MPPRTWSGLPRPWAVHEHRCTWHYRLARLRSQTDAAGNVPPRHDRASLGSDPGAKLILYSPGASYTISDVDNLRIIHEVLTQQSFDFKWHLHVRKLPKVDLNLSVLENDLGISSEMSGRVVESWADRFDQTAGYIRSLGRAVHHADVLIHVGSTIAIDAACHDTPRIGYGLDQTMARLPRTHVARHVFRLVHNRDGQ